MMDESSWERLAAVAYGLETLPEFEQWVYASPDLERTLGPSRYLDLISLDFRQPHAPGELSRLLRVIFAERRHAGIERDVARWIARALLTNTLDLRTTAGMLARLWSAGHQWVPSTFAYIDSELDDIPMPAQAHLWEPEAFARKRREAEPWERKFLRAAREAAAELLDATDTEPQGV